MGYRADADTIRVKFHLGRKYKKNGVYYIKISTLAGSIFLLCKCDWTIPIVFFQIVKWRTHDDIAHKRGMLVR